MTILKDVLAELAGMFVGDARLSAAILVVVVIAAGVIDLAGVSPLIGGTVLLGGCLAVMIFSVLSAAKSRANTAESGNVQD